MPQQLLLGGLGQAGLLLLVLLGLHLWLRLGEGEGAGQEMCRRVGVRLGAAAAAAVPSGHARWRCGRTTSTFCRCCSNS
jgi:hypothetical protein